MGAMWTSGNDLVGRLIKIVGYKLGLAVTVAEMDSAIAATGCGDEFPDDRSVTLRLRSEEFEELVAGVLEQFGDVDAVAGTVPPVISVMRSISEEQHALALLVLDDALPRLSALIDATPDGGTPDPRAAGETIADSPGPQADDLYELVTERASHGTLIMTSNRSAEHWYRLFPNPVVAESVLDRIINTAHHIHLDGRSYRPIQQPQGAAID